jgi:hypothetical protein
MAPELRKLSFGYNMTPMQIIQGLLSSSGSSDSASSGMSGSASGIADVMKVAAAMAAMSSDRRLKSNIVRLGTHPLGIGWYEYDIAGRRERGVMADEVLTVMPEAVVTMPNGYLGVRYDMVGRL